MGRVVSEGRAPPQFTDAPNLAAGKHDIVRAAMRAQEWLPGRDVSVFSNGEIGLQSIVVAQHPSPLAISRLVSPIYAAATHRTGLGGHQTSARSGCLSTKRRGQSAPPGFFRCEPPFGAAAHFSWKCFSVCRKRAERSSLPLLPCDQLLPPELDGRSVG